MLCGKWLYFLSQLLLRKRFHFLVLRICLAYQSVKTCPYLKVLTASVGKNDSGWDNMEEFNGGEPKEQEF